MNCGSLSRINRFSDRLLTKPLERINRYQLNTSRLIDRDLGLWHHDNTGDNTRISKSRSLYEAEAILIYGLPKDFYDEKGKLKDTELIQQTLVTLFQYIQTLSVIPKPDPCAIVAKLLINSIPYPLGTHVKKDQWATSNTLIDDTTWALRVSVWNAFHTDTPTEFIVPKETKREDVIKALSDVNREPWYYIAYSALHNLTSISNAHLFIRFFNNLNLGS